MSDQDVLRLIFALTSVNQFSIFFQFFFRLDLSGLKNVDLELANWIGYDILELFGLFRHLYNVPRHFRVKSLVAIQIFKKLFTSRSG